MKKTRTAKFYFICAAAILCGIAIVTFIFLSKDGDYKVLSSTASPDGKHVVTVYSAMGGGATGWCRINVAVDTKDERLNIEKGKDDYSKVVFDASCSSDPSINWDSFNKLTVKYSGSKDGTGSRIYKIPRSNDGAIDIVFIEK